MDTAFDKGLDAPSSDAPRDQSLIAWLDAIDWRCVGCGYSMHDLAGPMCPECGRPVTFDEVRNSLRFKPRPQPNETNPTWRRLRLLGTPLAWVVQSGVFVAATILLGNTQNPWVVSLIVGSITGLCVHLSIMYAGWWMGSIAIDVRLAKGKPPSLRKGFIARLYARMKGLLGAWSSLCIVLALLLGLIEWINF